MAKFIVTGGKGFIGHHLVKALQEQGHRVIVFDDGSTGKFVLRRTNVSYHRVDCATIDDQPELKNAAAIFHLAAKPRIPFSWEYPIEAHTANLTGTLNMLRLAGKYHIPKFIYSSSSSVYGEYDLAASEQYTPTNPVSPYGVQKLTGEKYGKLFAEKYGIIFIALRYFNVYGQGMSGGGYALCIQKMLDDLALDQVFTIDGDGDQKRDFTHVSDVVQANIRAAMTNLTGSFYAFNIGTGENHSINRLLQLIKPRYRHGRPRPNDPKQTLANIRWAYEVLNWEPQVTLEVGLQPLVDEILERKRKLNHS